MQGRPTSLDLSVVIPTLNEAENLRRLLPAVLAAAPEVVVSDGGSTDGSAELARRLGARVVEGAPGRGGQLNRGARAAAGAALLFLHADTSLPEGGLDAVRRALAEGAEGGGFLLRFDRPEGLYRLGGRLINLRTRLTRLPLGDQAQFLSRGAFERLGGYAEWPILEDLDLARRLKRTGRLAILPHKVTTSARRFARKGVLRTIAVNWWIWLRYFTGTPPDRLAHLYRRPPA